MAKTVNTKSTSKPFLRSRAPADRGYVPRLPHGSWRLSTGAQAESRIGSAGEFWNRLGL